MRQKLQNLFRKVVGVFSDDKLNQLLLESHLRQTFGDQKRQVEFLINNVFDYESKGLRRGGFFVDLACADGVSISNTYFLEKYLGWTGLLFEVNPKFLESIRNNRSQPLVTKCVTDTANSSVRFRIDNKMLGGIVSEHTDNSERVRGRQLRNAEIIDVPTTTLTKELDNIGAPPIIEFLSLDIEGAEWIALKNFNFTKYKFVCMAIERPSIALDLHLEKHGYKQVAHRRYDVIYVHDDYLHDVNFNPKLKFAFTPRKEW